MNNDNIAIRHLEKADIPDLGRMSSEIYIESFGHLYTPKGLQEHVAKYRSAAYFESVFDEDTILIAGDNETIVGYVQFGKIKSSFKNTGPLDRELGRLYVASDYQGLGVGRKLVKAALQHPELKQAKNIYLDVDSRNIKAQNLYKDCGFEVIDKIQWRLDDKHIAHDLVMKRKQ